MFVLTSSYIGTFDANSVSELFALFKKDFLDNDLAITKNSISYEIDVKPHITCTCPFFMDEKTEKFWHLITTDINANRSNRVNPCRPPKERKRRYDSARAKRIHWIKPVILQWQTEPEIKHFYQKRGNKVNLVLWYTNRNFAVIIRKLSHSSNRFLVSSYLIYESEVYRYKKQLKEYEKNAPLGIEWF
jgi:hypothetical protein